MKKRGAVLEQLFRSATRQEDVGRMFVATVFLIQDGHLRRVVVSFPLTNDDAKDVPAAHRMALEQAGIESASSVVLVGKKVFYIQQSGKQYRAFLVRG